MPQFDEVHVAVRARERQKDASRGLQHLEVEGQRVAEGAEVVPALGEQLVGAGGEERDGKGPRPVGGLGAVPQEGVGERVQEAVVVTVGVERHLGRGGERVRVHEVRRRQGHRASGGRGAGGELVQGHQEHVAIATRVRQRPAGREGGRPP